MLTSFVDSIIDEAYKFCIKISEASNRYIGIFISRLHSWKSTFIAVVPLRWANNLKWINLFFYKNNLSRNFNRFEFSEYILDESMYYVDHIDINTRSNIGKNLEFV